MTIEEIKEFLSENPKLYGELMTAFPDDELKTFLGTEKGRSFNDSAISRGVETWKANNTPKLRSSIKEELMKELNPQETDSEKENRLLKEQLEGYKKKEQLGEVNHIIQKGLEEKGLNSDFSKFIVNSDLEVSKQNLDSFAELFDNVLTSSLEKRLGETNTEPPAGEVTLSDKPLPNSHGYVNPQLEIKKVLGY